MTLTQVTTGGVDENINIDSNTLKVDGTNNRVGIGTTSPSRLLTIQSTGNANFCIKSANTGVSQCMFGDTDSDVAGNIAYRHSENAMTFEVNSAERARLDSTGRLLLGTTSGISSHPLLQIKGYVNGATGPGWMALASGNNLPTTNENMGMFSFFQNSGGESARIECEADANQSSTSADGRLVFMTTRGGDTSPTESMRISSSGNVSIGTSAATANLNVYGGASAALFQNSNTGTGSGDGFFVGNWGGLSASVWQYENDIINFGTNNA